ncbi:hypothetical protein PPL_00377 [Heterostelium album PN500]|uniref:Uncharacterized protein n=1 Tax=Heterostelium pallidum (strain ATCC 26659 / Pp 5 / PN500) TaxID=670386 RepID=D3AWA3_HETP5|nr:hypothetical protein PPL_00377 [Heterostelium album PN500]EFA86576.1 hypothetical protein PPL_00377 [Heterostelium album PN500]|eukprot:XP_020438681.1 hypothetical protein PPL_00377 [Heterostelium album PN500]
MINSTSTPPPMAKLFSIKTSQLVNSKLDTKTPLPEIKLNHSALQHNREINFVNNNNNNNNNNNSNNNSISINNNNINNIVNSNNNNNDKTFKSVSEDGLTWTLNPLHESKKTTAEINKLDVETEGDDVFVDDDEVVHPVSSVSSSSSSTIDQILKEEEDDGNEEVLNSDIVMADDDDDEEETTLVTNSTIVVDQNVDVDVEVVSGSTGDSIIAGSSEVGADNDSGADVPVSLFLETTKLSLFKPNPLTSIPIPDPLTSMPTTAMPANSITTTTTTTIVPSQEIQNAYDNTTKAPATTAQAVANATSTTTTATAVNTPSTIDKEIDPDITNLTRNRSYLYSNFQEEEPDNEIIINIEGIDSNNQFSLINFNRIFNLYYKCLENSDDQTRSQCVRYFIKYYEYKFLHYIDEEGFTKFIVDVFFDPSINVFNNMSLYNCGDNISLIQDIYKRIINDKRNRIEVYQECCNFKCIPEQYLDFNFYDFYNRLLTNDDTNINENQNTIVNQNELEKNDDDDNNNNNNSNNNYDNSNEENYTALVKSFILPEIFYYNITRHINLESKYSLIKSPPLFFDYESINFFKYGESTERTNQMFSRVQVFHIKSDEYDSNTNDGVRRHYFRDNNSFFTQDDEHYYRVSISKNRYLTQLPPMPQLKHISITDYHGYTGNYSSFLKKILESTPNGDGHGIESFYINIDKDWNDCPDYSNLNFLLPLLSLHSKTLKSVVISYDDSCKYGDVITLLEILKETLSTMKQYNYSFIMYGNFRMLKEQCNNEVDLEVYRYLLNQKKISNKFDYGLDQYDEDDLNDII